MTVLEVIQRGAEYLGKRGVESPRLQAELLLAHRLGLPRMQLYLNFERELGAAEVDAVRELVKRRGLREPLQHIVGSTNFCGLELAVDGRVLVPRPETEQLAEAGWEFLGGLATQTPVALDFGTGSGCLAITLAVKTPKAHIVALDISPEALEVARENAARHQVLERVELVLGDGLAALAPGTSFNLITANPPYIPSAEINTLEPEVRDHDPRAALDGGAEGLDFYRLLAAGAATHLKPAGRLMLEFGDGQAGAIRAMLEAEKWIVEAVQADYTGRMRILIAQPVR